MTPIHLTTMVGKTSVPVVVIAEHITLLQGTGASNRVGTWVTLTGATNPVFVEESIQQILELIPAV